MKPNNELAKTPLKPFKTKSQEKSQEASVPLLQIKSLSLNIYNDKKVINVLKNVDLKIAKGETMGLVGESGSGKSMLALCIPKLIPDDLRPEISGEIFFDGQPLQNKDASFMQELRRKSISIIFQDPLSSLNPLHTIGKQVAESIIWAEGKSPKRQMESEVLALLKSVELDEGEGFLKRYPNELSGGQRQRVMIAMALAKKPKLLIADEPTTALDVTIQQEIINLLIRLQKKMGPAILFISHDLNLVRRVSKDIAIIQNGVLLEKIKTEDVKTKAKHPYTLQLFSSRLPVLKREDAKSHLEEILKVENLCVSYPIKSNFLRRTKVFHHAVKNINFSLKTGRTLGIIGESGSGKSSLALAILRLVKSSGSILLLGKELQNLKHKELKSHRKNMQVVFQDPYASLSPRLTIFQIVSEGLAFHKKIQRLKLEQAVDEALKTVELETHIKNRFPHEFSGGERQRIAIARVLIMKPKLIILDEPTSSLDANLQKQILNLLLQLQKTHQMSYIFISHDIKTIRAISDEIMIMRDGNCVEKGESKKILEHPQEAYSQKLISAGLI